MSSSKALFLDLYGAATEAEVDQALASRPALLNPGAWHPLGDNPSNFGVVENQQSSPIAALIEKIINGVDAILMRKCIEAGIDPKSATAPRTIDEAVARFLPDHKNWDMAVARRAQAKHLQVLAHGPKLETSLVIYDAGEGQLPEDFEGTFLSLLRGNKNEVHFVQGKYNMGGTGAIAFCGTKRYQLIASRRMGSSRVGFTLVRRHPLSAAERQTKKNTWYEYLKIGGRIPDFVAQELDLGLYDEKFRAGSIVKLYSYQLPQGARSVIARDLHQSVNEYLFQPALPMFFVDNAKRYPLDRALERPLYGLKRRLEEEDSKYVEEKFSVALDDAVGKLSVTCYVFRAKVDEKTVKETRDTIRREFFKNDMAVLFSMNGQVHGHYTTEFITRRLKFNLLRDYLLIHVDCTQLEMEFRNELFMASRDRLKDGDASDRLRTIVANKLKDSRLDEIHRQRRASLSVESKDTEDLLKSFSRSMPFNPEFVRLLNQSLKTDQNAPNAKGTPAGSKGTGAPARPLPPGPPIPPGPSPAPPAPFQGKRFPSMFKLASKPLEDGLPMVQVPLGGEKRIKFSTDVEDNYFDRSDDPGGMELGLLDFVPNSARGGKKAGNPKGIHQVLRVARQSPHNGAIAVSMKATDEVFVGDKVKLKAELSAPNGVLQQVFWVSFTEQQPQPPPKLELSAAEAPLGLPTLVRTAQAAADGVLPWSDFAVAGIDFSWEVVVRPVTDGDRLDKIVINMDCAVLRDYRRNLKSQEQLEVADKRFISSVYFHTLFLYLVMKRNGFAVEQEADANGKARDVDLADYLSELMASHYAEFLLRFDVQNILASLSD